MSIVAQIEDAIIARIKAATGMGYTPQVGSYGGEFDGELPVVIRQFPAFWVTFKSAGKPTPVGTARDKYLVPLTFAVLAGARNVRGERATRHGGAAAHEVGVYQMLADAQTLLLRNDFGLEIDPLSPGSVHTLYNSKLNNQGIAVFAQEWHTKYVMSEARVLAPLPDLLAVGLNYFLQPDDGRMDASDDVTLA